MKNLSFGRILMWGLLLIILFLTLFPFWWVLRTALTTQGVLYSNTTQLLPVGFTLDNFIRVLGLVDTSTSLEAGGSGQSLKFFLFLRNSVIFATAITLGQVFFSTMAAYAFARLKFRGRNFLFTLYVSALMVPGIVTLIPNFILVRNMSDRCESWTETALLSAFGGACDYVGPNTFSGMVAPYFLMTPFAVFFLRQFFLGINRELEEAAKIDGAGYVRIFRSIILPLAQPPIVTLGIITFIQAWNEYLWPLVIGKDESVRVLTVALNIFRQQQPSGLPDWTGLMAGTFLSILPILFLYMIVGRRVINSIQFTGFK